MRRLNADCDLESRLRTLEKIQGFSGNERIEKSILVGFRISLKVDPMADFDTD